MFILLKNIAILVTLLTIRLMAKDVNNYHSENQTIKVYLKTIKGAVLAYGIEDIQRIQPQNIMKVNGKMVNVMAKV